MTKPAGFLVKVEPRIGEMDGAASDYDPRYLAGVLLFNRGDFFEAHEAWEALWMETAGAEKKFYQGLIQAAVGLCHFCNGNVRGAVKLYRSARDYMTPYGQHYLGLDNEAFWQQMQQCFAELLAASEPDRRIEIDEALIPTITLKPPPDTWPDPAEYLEPESDHERGRS
jgi:predicted metal-dependent hydrolase